MTTAATNYAYILKEAGVSDLKARGLKLAGLFAKAIHLEREAGHTTPEAMEVLAQAIEVEAALDAA